MDPQAVIEATRRWISSAVIGLNLCPFARRVFEGEKIRYAVSLATDEAALLDDLSAELKALTGSSEYETAILIHPRVLTDFLQYNDFLDAADRLIARLGMRDEIQVASFHPDYQFTNAEPDAVENYTNRSPYPMLHLLREESITAVADDAEALAEIPRRNIETLRRLGREKLLALLAEAKGGADS